MQPVDAVPSIMRAARHFKDLPGWAGSRDLLREVGRLRSYKQGSSEYASNLSKLLDYFPTLDGAKIAFLTMVQDASDLFRQHGEDAGVPPLLADLTAAELGRRRYAHSLRPSPPFDFCGPRWGRGFTLYSRLLPPAVERWLIRTLEMCGFFQCDSSTFMAKGLKVITDAMKKYGNLISPFWRYAVNLETLGGYRPRVPMAVFMDDLKSWVTGDVMHTSFDGRVWSEDAFLSDFRAGVSQFLSRAPSVSLANKEALPLDEWVSDPLNWSSDGATQIKDRLLVKLKGKTVPLERSKRTSSLLLPPQVVKQMVLKEKHRQHLKPIEKCESGKVRAVVNSDDTLYLKMAFVSNWLELALKHHPQTTLFMSARQRHNMWQRLAKDCFSWTTKMPLDQSHFDWQVNKRMLSVVIDEIRNFIATHCSVDRDTLLEVVDTIHYSVVEDSADLVVDDVDFHALLKVTKGVMSGWRWTALIDTLCNAGELFAADQLVKRWGFPHSILSFIAQGDDDQLTCSSFADATALAFAYSTMNFEVNPGKFFVDTYRDEYLRLVPERGRVVGYPARAINNILWRNPINPDPLVGEVTIRSQLSQWMLLVNRGCSWSRVKKHMISDMLGRNKFLTKQELIDYLTTPAPYGGCGLVGTDLVSTRQLRVTQSRLRVDYSVVSELPGLSVVNKIALNMGVPQAVLDEATKSVLPTGRLAADVQPPEVVPVRVGFTKPPLPSFQRVPSSYSMDEKKIPRFLSQHYTKYLLRRQRYDTLRELASPKVEGWFDIFQSRLTKSAFADWITGHLDNSAPTVAGYSPEQVSVVWKDFVAGLLVQVSHEKRVSRSRLRNLAVAAVAPLRRELGALLPISG